MNRRIAGWAVAATLAILGGTTACSSEPTQVSVSAGASAATAPAAGAELDAEAFAAALKRAGTIVLDVRTPAEFAAGHLPGAVNIDVEAPDFGTRIAALDASLPYAVYCRSGNRSGVALAAMAAAPLAAQVRGLPVVNNGVPTGIGLAATQVDVHQRLVVITEQPGGSPNSQATTPKATRLEAAITAPTTGG